MRLEKVDLVINQLVLRYLHKKTEKIKKASPYTRLWCLFDLLTVFLHLIAIIIFGFFPIALIFF